MPLQLLDRLTAYLLVLLRTKTAESQSKAAHCPEIPPGQPQLAVSQNVAWKKPSQLSTPV